jgi:hypothetical protein
LRPGDEYLLEGAIAVREEAGTVFRPKDCPAYFAVLVAMAVVDAHEVLSLLRPIMRIEFLLIAISLF